MRPNLQNRQHQRNHLALRLYHRHDRAHAFALRQRRFGIGAKRRRQSRRRI